MERISCNPSEALVFRQDAVADEAVRPEVGNGHLQRIASLSQEASRDRSSPRLAPHHAEISIIDFDCSDVGDPAQRDEEVGPRIPAIAIK